MVKRTAQNEEQQSRDMVVVTEGELPLPKPDISWTKGVYRGSIIDLSPILDSTGTHLLYYQLPNGDLISPIDILPPPETKAPAK